MIQMPPSNPQNRAPVNPSKDDVSRSSIIDGATSTATGAGSHAEEGSINESAHLSINQQQTLNASTHNTSAFSSNSRRSGQTVLDRILASAEKVRRNSQEAIVNNDQAQGRPRRHQPLPAASTRGTGSLPQQNSDISPGQKRRGRKKDKLKHSTRGAAVPLMVDARTRHRGLQLSALHQHPRQVPRVASNCLHSAQDFTARYNNALQRQNQRNSSLSSCGESQGRQGRQHYPVTTLPVDQLQQIPNDYRTYMEVPLPGKLLMQEPGRAAPHQGRQDYEEVPSPGYLPRQQSGRVAPFSVPMPNPGFAANNPGQVRTHGQGVPTQAPPGNPGNNPPPNIPGDREAPDAFYLALPAPWNIVPTVFTSSTDDYIKYVQKGKVIVFNGETSSYDSWREKFMQSFHIKRSSPAVKALALQASLDAKVPSLKLLASTIPASEQGYRDLIEDLEAQFGGIHRLRRDRLKQVLATPIVKVGNLSVLHEFVLKLKSFVAALETGHGTGLQTQEEDSNYFLAASRLDSQLGLRYTDWLTTHGGSPTLATLLRFAQAELSRCRMLGDMSTHFLEKAPAYRQSRTFVARGGESEDESDINYGFKIQEEPDCDACNGQHLLKSCPTFLAMTPQERLDLMTEKRRCYRCLRLGHGANTCTTTAKCQVCDRQHHSLLHGATLRKRGGKPQEKTYLADEEQDLDEPEPPIKITEQAYAAGERGEVSLGTVPLHVRNGKTNIEINALLDNGNTTSLLSEEAAAALGLTGYQEHAVIEGICGRKIESKIRAYVRVRSKDGSVEENVLVRVVPKPAGSLRAVDWNKHKQKFSYLKDIQFPEPCERRVVDLILGNTVAKLMSAKTGDICGPRPDDPIARKTPLGWVAAGKLDPDMQTEDAKTFMSFFLTERQSSGNCEPSIKVKRMISSPFATVEYALLSNPPEKKSPTMKCCPSPSDLRIQVLLNSANKNSISETTRGADVPSMVDTRTRPKHKEEEKHARLEEPVRGADVPSMVDTRNRQQDLKLTELLERQWAIEETAEDEEKALSKEERRALHLLNSKGEYAPHGGGATMPCLWREGEPILPYNYHEARKMYTRRLLSRTMQDNAIREAYNKPLQNYEKKGFFKEAPLGSGKFYLDHFPVYKQDKVSSKVRPVFNGALKFYGKSLNDSILAGPKMINEIPDVLMHFRKERICVSCDIKEMFLNIRLQPEDQPFHHFLWSATGRPEDIKDYVWVRHIFGNTGSPCVAIFTIKHYAEVNKEKFPAGSYVVIHCTIVDDNLTSAATVEQVLEIIRELKELYGEIGMVVCKFMSNSPEVMATLDESEKAPNMDLSELQSSALTTPTLKALGVFYSSKDDAFSFKMEVPPEKDNWTKRDVLSFYASLFDPHGFIAPVVIKARIIFQALWPKNYEWDDLLKAADLRDWLEWIDGVTDFPKFRIPRCLFDASIKSEVVQRVLHVFCDASTQAFAAAVYLFCRFTNGQSSSRLVQARSKLAPIKAVSVPRLELMAALLGTELAKKCLRVQDCQDVLYWTDSMNVLCWLKTESRQLHTFVANRVAKIQRATNPESWHWIPSEENPADLASRGVLPEDLIPRELWWQGPKDRLEGPPPPIPELSPTAATEKELKRGEMFSFKAEQERPPVMSQPSIIDHTRSSSWPKLVRAQAYVMRLPTILQRLRSNGSCNLRSINVTKRKVRPREKLSIHNYDPPLSTVIPPITPDEFLESEHRLLLSCQAESFSKDLADLQHDGSVKPRSPLVKLRPFLDDKRLLRLGGRLRMSSHMPFEEKCPILLPRGHHITRLIIWHYHAEVNKHIGGTAHTHASVTTRFWPVGGRQEVKKVLQRCTKCRRNNAKVKPQEEAPLPDCRFRPQSGRVAPFMTTGVDAAGPFHVTLGRGSRKNAAQHKRYIIIFTCAVYRAVHFELVETLEADSFLIAFSNFLARRPRPKLVISDNGGNFRRTAALLDTLFENLRASTEQLSQHYPDVHWRFNTPLSPHQGGFFERLIGSMKKALNVVLPTCGKLKEEELRSCVIVSEGILNSRPLTYVGTDPDDLAVLTPAHFLNQSMYADLVPADDDVTPRFAKRWFNMQKVLDRLWTRFIREVVPQLNVLNKWTTKRIDLRTGDVCVLLEEKHRGVWPLAVVEEVIVSPTDGHARSAKVRSGGRILERSLSRILVIQESSSQ